MVNLTKATTATIDSHLGILWTRYRSKILWFVIRLMVVVAVIWLGYEFWRLLWQPGEMGAIDLRLRYFEVQEWFTGRPIYEQVANAVYPPASYVMLWPFLGWLSVSAARWFWAATSIIALLWLIQLTLRESGASTPQERALIALIPLVMYGTGATIGNGQLALHVLPCLMASILWLRQRQRGWYQDLLIAALMLFALVKPTISVPFFWIVLFVPTGLRPASFVCLGYAGLTQLASLFQTSGPVQLFWDWVTAGTRAAEWGATHGEGSIDVHVNVHSVASAFNIVGWNPYFSLILLSLLGIWIYHYRHRDLWLLVGVTAIVARFWTYHGWYDDLLLLLPIIALFRISKQGLSSSTGNSLSGFLCAITLLSVLAPGGLYLLPAPWNSVYVAGQTIIWLGVMIFLGHQASRRPTSTAVPKLY